MKKVPENLSLSLGVDSSLGPLDGEYSELLFDGHFLNPDCCCSGSGQGTESKDEKVGVEEEGTVDLGWKVKEEGCRFKSNGNLLGDPFLLVNQFS